ncbi:MAG: DUF3568 family protein [Opitutae bacterium]|nr:DUF3568 family protein [Opitutae bacterium]
MNPHRTPSRVPFRALLAALLVAATVANSGCVLMAGAAAGAGAVAYAGRELQANQPADYAKVVDATRLALKELEFARVSENKDALKAVFVSRTALDKKVEITVTNAGKNATNLTIQVGLFGDRELSLAILEKIKSLL